MFAKQLLLGLTLVSSIVALQDCCYLEPDHLTSEGGMKYRTNAVDGIFYDSWPDGSSSFCGLQITRDASDEDNCATVTMASYYGYCNGVVPEPVTCTDEYVVKTYPGADSDNQTTKSRRRQAGRLFRLPQ